MSVNKIVYPYSEIKGKILEAVDMISDPVRQTLSPRGGNVLFEDSNGEPKYTNDGATIARNINVKDPVYNYVINIIKQSSLKTNLEAGDGTTTSIVLTRILVKEGFKMLEEGVNLIELKKKLEDMADTLVKRVKDKVIKIKNDSDLENIATISANNDKDIAKDVVDIVKFAGEDGMIFIEPNNKIETEILTEPGFRIDSGMFAAELKTSPHRYVATYKNVPVLITDKRIYYTEEAESILNTVLKAGHKSVVVVARDFIGESPKIFIGNHTKGVIKVLLVKDDTATEKDTPVLDDLAVYLNGKVIKEKSGSLVNKLKIEDFCFASNVYSDGEKTIITPKIVNEKDVNNLVKELKAELKDKLSRDDPKLKKRIASLTSGTTTVKVGGATNIEITEKIYRYEDAINASRAAVKDGYLIGGGVTLLKAYNKDDYDETIRPLAKKFTEASIRQIAENCGKHADFIIEQIVYNKNKNYGYNALTDSYGDLLEEGVIDPFKVTEMAIRNAVSVSNALLSSNYIIVNDREDDTK